jgi:hypothetical protein
MVSGLANGREDFHLGKMMFLALFQPHPELPRQGAAHLRGAAHGIVDARCQRQPQSPFVTYSAS